jgi:hypothetical protein
MDDLFWLVQRDVKRAVPRVDPRRRIRALHELRIGLRVWQPQDTEAGVIVNISYCGSQTGSEKKWAWLRYGTNTYVKLCGSQALYQLEIEQEYPQRGA